MRGIARRSWATKGIGATGIAGLALVAAAALLMWSSAATGQGVPGVHAAVVTDTPMATATAVPTARSTRTPVPTPLATVNPDCDLSISKDASVSTVAEGGEIAYTITVTNDGEGSGSCSNVTVSDVIPANTTCVSAAVDSSSDIASSNWGITHKCPRSSGTITWHTAKSLSTSGDKAVLTMVVDVTSDAKDGDKITNEACAISDDDEAGDCHSAQTDVSNATATPTAAPVATFRPVELPPYLPPTVAPLVVPNTGSGPGSGSNSALAIALGLAGGALVLLSGTGVWLRRRS